MYARMLIGRVLTITESRDDSLLGVKGKIIDETRNTFLVEKNDGRRIRIPKGIVKLQLLGVHSEHLAGEALIGTAQERIYKY